MVSSPFGIACHTTNRHRAEVSQLQEGFTAYKGHLLRSMHQSLSCVLYKSFSSPDLQPSPSHLDPLRPFDMPSIQTFGAAQAAQNRAAFCSRPAAKASPVPARAVMVRGHSEGGPFSPLVVVTRNVMGKKEFNKFRGKAISVHSQVCAYFLPTSHPVACVESTNAAHSSYMLRVSFVIHLSLELTSLYYAGYQDVLRPDWRRREAGSTGDSASEEERRVAGIPCIGYLFFVQSLTQYACLVWAAIRGGDVARDGAESSHMNPRTLMTKAV